MGDSSAVQQGRHQVKASSPSSSSSSSPPLSSCSPGLPSDLPWCPAASPEPGSWPMYVNPTKNRDLHLNVVRVPGKSAHVVITNGARKHDLTFKVGDIDFKSLDGVFNIDV